MRGNEFLDKVELIDPKYIEAADTAVNKKSRTFIKYTAIAACLAIAVFSAARIAQHTKIKDDAPRLPAVTGTDITADNTDPQEPVMLSIPESFDSAAGFEGYMAYDISELVSGNPWNEDMRIAELPVYKNPISYDIYHIARGVDYEKMKELLIETSERLGIDTSAYEITDDAPTEEQKQRTIEKLKTAGYEEIPDGYFDPTYLMIDTGSAKIKVNVNMAVSVELYNGESFIDEVNNSSYDSCVSVAEYVKNEYKNILNMTDPQINISGGDRSTDLTQNYYIEFYDGSGNDVEKIVNYSLNNAVLYSSTNLTIYNYGDAEKVGDYPIITADEAKELLIGGNYITTVVQYDFPGAKYITKVELIYRSDATSEYFIPYYRFYIELPEAGRDDLKTYGAYYVPAVESKYILNMPLWDGSFN